MRDWLLTNPHCRQIVLIICLLFFSIFPLRLHAQEPFIERFSFRTNTLDWLATIPNATIGFDLLPGEYNNMSVLAGIKWNWNTFHKIPDYYVFNVFDVRAEYRYHFRFTKVPEGQKPKFFSKERRNPRTWLARYLGGYVNYGTFSFKPGATGRQGWQVGLGVSAGVEFPLYQYKSGAIDMDLGASAGVTVSRFNLYSLNEGHSAFVMGESRFMILPTIAELRAVISWRKTSVKQKYLKEDPEKDLYAQALKDVRSDFENTNKITFDESRTRAQERLYQQSDSAYVADFKAWLQENLDDELKKIEQSNVSPSHQKQLKEEAKRLSIKVENNFMTEFHKIQAEKNKAKRKAEAEVKKTESEAKKAAAEKAREEKAAAKAKAKEEEAKAKEEKAAAKAKAKEEAKAKAKEKENEES